MYNNKIEFVKLYAVHSGGNEFSSGKPTWFFTDYLRAKHNSKGVGFYGSDATISEVDAVSITTSPEHFGLPGETMVYLLASPDRIKVNYGPNDIKLEKEKALAKLSDYEKSLLGLS